MRVAWLLVIAGCGRLGFDATGATDAPPAPADGVFDAPPDASITPGTMTIGFPQVGTSTQNTSTNRVWISTFALPQAGKLQRLKAYMGVGGGQGANVRGVVYADAAGTPTALVAQTQSVSLAAQSPLTWITLSLAAEVALAPGTYWIGIQNDTAAQIAYQVTIGGTKNTGDLYSDGPMTTYGGGVQTFTMQLSVYGEYLP